MSNQDIVLKSSTNQILIEAFNVEVIFINSNSYQIRDSDQKDLFRFKKGDNMLFISTPTAHESSVSSFKVY